MTPHLYLYHLHLTSHLPTPKPSLCPSDRVSSTVPKNLSITTEYLQKCTGFRNIASIMKQLKPVIADTITISDIGCDPIKSRGKTATMNKKNRKKIRFHVPTTLVTSSITTSATVAAQP